MQTPTKQDSQDWTKGSIVSRQTDREGGTERLKEYPNKVFHLARTGPTTFRMVGITFDTKVSN